MEVITNGRYLITLKPWGSGVFEIYIDEISPSGNWIKLSSAVFDAKGGKKTLRGWYRRSEITFHEELINVAEDLDVTREIEGQLE